MRVATMYLVIVALLATGCKTMPLGKSIHGCSDGSCSQGGCGPAGCQPAGYGPSGQGGHAGKEHGGLFGQWHGRRGTPNDYIPRGQGLPEDVMRGDATPTVSYPYYSVRGPRDYFLDNPPSIGP